MWLFLFTKRKMLQCDKKNQYGQNNMANIPRSSVPVCLLLKAKINGTIAQVGEEADTSWAKPPMKCYDSLIRVTQPFWHLKERGY